MAFSNLADLRGKVANYVQRVGDSDFSAEFPVLVQLVEDQINGALYGLNEDGDGYANMVSALEDDTDTNWILNSFGSVYFFGTIMEAAIAGLASSEQGQIAGMKFNAGLETLKTKRRAQLLKPAKPGGTTP